MNEPGLLAHLVAAKLGGALALTTAAPAAASVLSRAATCLFNNDDPD